MLMETRIRDVYCEAQIELLRTARNQLEEGFHDGGDDLDYFGCASDLIYIVTQLVSNPWGVDLKRLYREAGVNKDFDLEQFLLVASEIVGEKGIDIFRSIVEIYQSRKKEGRY